MMGREMQLYNNMCMSVHLYEKEKEGGHWGRVLCLLKAAFV